MSSTLASSSLEQDLADVVVLLSERKRRVWFVGGRFSQLVATYLYMQLRMLRPGCLMVAEAPQRRVLDSMDIARRDLLCLFDYRRYQEDTIEAGRRAAEQGAVVVVFTDPWLSPAVEYGRHVLISHAVSASPFDSLLGAFALTELIAAKVLTKLGDGGRSRVAQLEEVHGHLLDPPTAVASVEERGLDAG